MGEINTYRGSAVVYFARPGQAVIGMAMRSKAGCALVEGLKKIVRAARIAKHVIRAGQVIGVALEGVHRTGGAGVDKVNGSVIGISEAACFRAGLLGSRQVGVRDKIDVSIIADLEVLKGVSIGRQQA